MWTLPKRSAERRARPAHRTLGPAGLAAALVTATAVPTMTALVALTAASPAPLAGQEPTETIITDRPGTPDGAWVVGLASRWP